MKASVTLLIWAAFAFGYAFYYDMETMKESFIVIIGMIFIVGSLICQHLEKIISILSEK